jgi:diguanylate cyclase (GGDEF)-like protein
MISGTNIGFSQASKPAMDIRAPRPLHRHAGFDPTTPPLDLTRPQVRSLGVIVTTFILLLAVSLIASWGAIRVVDATRAYATGEGRYSKAQKIAVLNLYRFAYSGRQSDYDAFLAATNVPRGDRRARLALESQPVDVAGAASGFLAGQNHSDDVPGLIALFRTFSWWQPFAAAVADWREGDRLVGDLIEEGALFKQLVDSGKLDPQLRARELDIVNTIDEHLTELENTFSTHMGEAARAATMLVVIGLGLTTALLWIIGMVFATRLFRQQLALDRQLGLSEQRFRHMALHDPLTDLPNRVLFRQRLEEALHHVARGEPCAVLCLDLDQFKDVNDTLGHPVGDGLLNAVVERIGHMMRPTDTFARLGGDEFAIVQSRIDHPLDASALATRLLRELSTPFEVAGHHVVISTSIGIAIAPGDGSDPDLLLKSADIALYQAKSDGRNRFRYFEPEMHTLIQARRELELDLRKALVAGEFELFFQPFFNLVQNRITGFEALLRWPHPQRGMVSPSDFIPVAEEMGLITQIGEWVLHRACQYAMCWPEPLKVAVNISTVQFKARNLVQTVTEALQESGLDPSRLELEITESVMIHDLDAAVFELGQLKELGVSISMDDFGTGYSSLSYLRSFSFDKIKIDQSFVRELGKKADCAAIIRTVIGMCETLDATVTAEGVETEQQLNLLRAEGCTEIQGYLISRPVPARDIPAMLIGDFSRNGQRRSRLPKEKKKNISA